MAIEVNGQTVATTENGYLEDLNDWSEAVAEAMAKEDGVELTDKHWDVIKYLRDEHINNGGNEPMERVLMKDMGKIWGKKLSSKDLYRLFPGAPSKQGNRIAGLPYIARKGGY